MLVMRHHECDSSGTHRGHERDRERPRGTDMASKRQRNWLFGLFLAPTVWGGATFAAHGQTTFRLEARPELEVVYRLEERYKPISLFGRGLDSACGRTS